MTRGVAATWRRRETHSQRARPGPRRERLPRVQPGATLSRLRALRQAASPCVGSPLRHRARRRSLRRQCWPRLWQLRGRASRARRTRPQRVRSLWLWPSRRLREILRAAPARPPRRCRRWPSRASSRRPPLALPRQRAPPPRLRRRRRTQRWAGSNSVDRASRP